MSIKLLLGGDIMIGRSFNDLFDKQSLDYPWEHLKATLQSSDGLIANLETTITRSDKKWPDKTFNYRLNPDYAGTLTYANPVFLSLANNHIMDFQEEGLKETVNVLGKLGIAHAGVNYPARSTDPAFIQKNGIRIGFLSAADHYDYWSDYLWHIDIRSGKWPDKIFQIVKETKKQCDYLIFSLHWNYNYVDKIEPIFRQFAHKLIDSGVDIIHGHSPHHLLPIEYHNGGLIFYSLGDLIDDYAINQKYRNDLSALIEITFSKEKMKMSNIVPTIIDNMQVKESYKREDRDYAGKALALEAPPGHDRP